MKPRNLNSANKTFFGLALAFFALGLGTSKAFWIPALIFLVFSLPKSRR